MIVCSVCLCLEQNALLQDKYKFYLPLWRQEMKDNSAIKCPNFSVGALYSLMCIIFFILTSQVLVMGICLFIFLPLVKYLCSLYPHVPCTVL